MQNQSLSLNGLFNENIDEQHLSNVLDELGFTAEEEQQDKPINKESLLVLLKKYRMKLEESVKELQEVLKEDIKYAKESLKRSFLGLEEKYADELKMVELLAEDISRKVTEDVLIYAMNRMIETLKQIQAEVEQMDDNTEPAKIEEILNKIDNYFRLSNHPVISMNIPDAVISLAKIAREQNEDFKVLFDEYINQLQQAIDELMDTPNEKVLEKYDLLLQVYKKAEAIQAEKQKLIDNFKRNLSFAFLYRYIKAKKGKSAKKQLNPKALYKLLSDLGMVQSEAEAEQQLKEYIDLENLGWKKDQSWISFVDDIVKTVYNVRSRQLLLPNMYKDLLGVIPMTDALTYGQSIEVDSLYDYLINLIITATQISQLMKLEFLSNAKLENLAENENSEEADDAENLSKIFEAIISVQKEAMEKVQTVDEWIEKYSALFKAASNP